MAVFDILDGISIELQDFRDAERALTSREYDHVKNLARDVAGAAEDIIYVLNDISIDDD